MTADPADAPDQPGAARAQRVGDTGDGHFWPTERSDSSKAVVGPNPLLAAAARTDPDDLCGALLADRYRLLRILGQGGMGYVYLAQHVGLDKPIAVKVLGTRWARQPEFRDRFLVEVKATSKVRHENVIEVTDFGETPNGSVFMAMELLRGEALSELIAREGPLPWPRAKGIALQVCRALHAAHDKGVLHRDVKPENCFRMKRGANKDFIKMLDFGLAKIFGDELDPHSSLTRAGAIFGTPEYMSPEQARGKKCDGRTDVYAAGVLIYELVTGQVPFSGETFMDVLTKQCTEPPADSPDEGPVVPQRGMRGCRMIDFRRLGGGRRRSSAPRRAVSHALTPAGGKIEASVRAKSARICLWARRTVAVAAMILGLMGLPLLCSRQSCSTMVS